MRIYVGAVGLLIAVAFFAFSLRSSPARTKPEPTRIHVGAIGRSMDREWSKELIGYLVTIRDENGEPLTTIAIGPDGEPISKTPWSDENAETPTR